MRNLISAFAAAAFVYIAFGSMEKDDEVSIFTPSNTESSISTEVEPALKSLKKEWPLTNIYVSD